MSESAMIDVATPAPRSTGAGHVRWVRVSHWIVTVAFLVLAVTGVLILMVHPRLYWGEAGNDLTPALVELPISRNYKHGGWENVTPFTGRSDGPVTASRTYDIFNQNGWGRSLHFLAGWVFFIAGGAYLLCGLSGGHLRSHLWPRRTDVAWQRLRVDLADHARLAIAPATGGPSYGPLQKLSYTAVVFVLLPLMGITGLTMSPAVTSAYPVLLDLFGGYQSARTIHFAVFVALILFLAVHLLMVVLSGLRRQLRGMVLGK